MIAVLSGVLSEKLDDLIVLDVGGVGYGINVDHEDFGNLNIGDQYKLYIYEHIREQSHDLFGFLSRDTQTLFERLLEVNGVGPKMALNMLSIGSSTELKQAIAGGDVKYISRASGVGKRVAERVVVDLKDKVGLIGVDIESTGLLVSEASLAKDDAAEALVALGYTAADAAKALQSVDKDLSTEERIKQALSK